jgi:hypothetical protein
MVAGVRANISLTMDATLIGTNDLGSPKQRVLIDEALAFAAGTAAVNQADLMFADTRTIAASGSEDLDLAGVLTDAFGQLIAAAEIVLIYVKAAAANTNSVIIGAATAPFAGPLGALGTYTVKPGEFYFAASESGWAVGAGATDDLKIANSGGTTGVTYDIVVLGRTVAA